MNNKDKYKEAKSHLGSLYGKTVIDFASNLDTCKHCPHFDEDEFKCDKIRHCDCDCPDCSPESYV